jgi:hypothetical protein
MSSFDTMQASNMILHIHNDASYLLTKSKARSRAGGHHFLSDKPCDQPARPNRPILNQTKKLRNVMSSTAEAEVGALFLNAREGTVLRNMIDELGHAQPATPLQTDNSTADGIINGTVKQQRSKAIDTCFHWVGDLTNQQGHFNIFWTPGHDNLGDCFTKHHPLSHHRLMQPVFLHEKHTIKPRFLPACVNSRDQGKVARKSNVQPAYDYKYRHNS